MEYRLANGSDLDPLSKLFHEYPREAAIKSPLLSLIRKSVKQGVTLM